MPTPLDDLIIPTSPEEQRLQKLELGARRTKPKNIMIGRILEREGVDVSPKEETPGFLQTVFNALNTEIGTSVGALIAVANGERDIDKIIKAGAEGWKKGLGVADLLHDTNALEKIADLLPKINPDAYTEEEKAKLKEWRESKNYKQIIRAVESAAGLVTEIAIPPLAVQGATKLLGKAGKAIVKSKRGAQLINAIKKTEVAQIAGRTFIYDFNLPGGYSNIKRMAKFWKQNRSHDLIEDIGTISTKLTDAERLDVGRALIFAQEQGRDAALGTLKNRESLEAFEQARTIFDKMLEIEKKAGIKVGDRQFYTKIFYEPGKTGPVEDVARQLARRAKEHVNAVANKTLIDRTIKGYGIKVNPKDFKIGGKYYGGGKRIITKPGFAKPRKLSLKESLEFAPPKLPEGYKLYMPTGDLKFYKLKFFYESELSKLKTWANQIKKTEQISILKKTTGKGKVATSGPIKRLEQTVREALTERGFTVGEADAYIHKIRNSGSAAIDDLFEETETIKRTIISGVNTPLMEVDAKTAIAVSKKVPAYLLPESVVNDINKITKTDVDEVVRFWNKPLNLWKSYATVVNPGFHLRNAYSNLWLNYLGGVTDTRKYSQSLQMLTHQNLDELIDGGKYTYGKVLELAKQHGIKGKGWLGADIPVEESIERLVARTGEAKWKKLRLVNPLGTENIAFEAGRKVGTSVENHARVTLFLDALVKGETPEQAAKRVRKYLFDYTELTDREKQIKNLVPFYTWMRKNIPLQVVELIKQPKKYADVGKLIRATEHLSEPIDKELLPEYYKELYAIQTPFETDKGHTLFFNPNFPWQDLNKLDTDTMYKNILSSLRPEFQVIIFSGTGKIPFSGREIPEDLEVEAPKWASKLPGPARKVIGVNTKTYKGREVTLMPARTLVKLRMIMPFLRKLERTFPTKAMENDPNLPSQIMSDLVGIKFMPFKQREAEAFKVFKEKKRLKELSKQQHVLEDLFIRME